MPPEPKKKAAKRVAAAAAVAPEVPLSNPQRDGLGADDEPPPLAGEAATPRGTTPAVQLDEEEEAPAGGYPSENEDNNLDYCYVEHPDGDGDGDGQG